VARAVAEPTSDDDSSDGLETESPEAGNVPVGSVGERSLGDADGRRPSSREVPFLFPFLFLLSTIHH
jgi:hypothetical protein